MKYKNINKNYKKKWMTIDNILQVSVVPFVVILLLTSLAEISALSVKMAALL